MSRRRASGDEGDAAPVGFGRRRRIALAGAAALALVATGLWVERRPIAERLIDRTLAAHGVPARYTIADLGPGRQRLTGVVVGDPRDPDLVADWIETETSLGLGGARLSGVRAGHVRARARLVGGRLSFGMLDRLLPARGGGGGAALPALLLDVADARLRLDTPAGRLGVALAGRGRLDRDFTGQATVAGDALSGSGCSVMAPRGRFRVRTGAGSIRLTGPATAPGVRCGAMLAAAVSGNLDATIRADASRWQGSVRLAAARLVHPQAAAQDVAGAVRFAGAARRTTGTLVLAGQRIAAGPLHAARATVAGPFAIGATPRLDADIVVTGGALDPAALAGLRRGERAVAGLPLAPLARQAGEGLTRAAQRFGGTARLAVIAGPYGAQATLTGAALVAASGATARFQGALALIAPRLARGSLALGGGGLPSLDAAVTTRADGSVEGAIVAAPYTAGGARLSLTPVAFAWQPGRTLRVATTATLSGAIAGGAIAGLVLPLAVRVDARGVVSVGEGCTPVAFDRLALGSLTLAPARLSLCPTGAALVQVAGGRVEGGATTGPVRLAGRIGTSPLALAASGVRATTDGAVTVTGLKAALGTADRPTLVTATQVEARAAGGAVAGTVAGLGGRIGDVPLLLADGAGTWRVAGGALDLHGALTVLDAAAADPRACSVAGAAAGLRFCPMLARDIALRLGGGGIAVTGTLAEPATGTRVAAVTIAHDLASGDGRADLTIDALSFGKPFQPNRLTPIVEGVVADVAGTIDGRARIGWGAGGVTSTGRFATTGLDLAAAFGPVTGIAGSIAFTDLLSLTSAPGQVLTVRSINPGIAVEDGTVRFHTEPGVKVAVEGARWPFAGGTLTLDPTLLDFAAPAERRMTFRLDGVAADRFLQQFDFKNLAATGTFDGVLPMAFDTAGGRIEHGTLTVRNGGGTLAYVGEVGEKDVGFWGNLAFQALKSLRYRSLAIAMDGPLAGDMVTEVRFAGVSQGAGARSNFLIRRLQRLPFVFNVRIKAPFRTLLDGLDPVHQAQVNLPRLIDQERATAVQPPASAPVP